MTFYKDFGKETKDLLTKNVAEGKPNKEDKGFPAPVWKVESKLKVKKGCVVVNPVADSKSVSANVEYSCCDGVKVKLNVKPDYKAWKPTASYEVSGRKVEVSTASITQFAVGDVTVEDKQKSYAAIVKVSRDDKGDVKANVEAAAPIIPDVSAGASLELPLTGAKKYNTSKWSAGLRYQPCKSTVFGFGLSALDSVDIFGTGAVPSFQLEGKPVNVGAVVTVKRDKSWGAVVGATGKVPMCPCGSDWKVKVDSRSNVSVSQIMACSGWKVSWTFDVVARAIGFTATLE